MRKTEENRPLLLTEGQSLLCGIGQGADCCAYLVVGSGGFECGRAHSEFKRMIDRRVHMMSAKRRPRRPFPNCQTEGKT